MRKWDNYRFREHVAGYLFILPNLLGVLIFMAVPLLFSMVLIFLDWDYLKGLGGLQFTGLDNLARMFDDDRLPGALRNNFIYTAVTVPASMAIGLLLAVALNRSTYGKGMLRTMFFLPHVCSLAVVAVVWSIMYNSQEGPINGFLLAVGIDQPPGWLASPDWALVAIMIIKIWASTGYTMVLYLAGLQGISKDLYEASEIDGASKLRQLLRITIPLLQPTTFLLAVMMIIGSFQVFALVSVMTKGGPMNSTMVISYHIYSEAFQHYRMGYASALSWLLFVLIFIITLVQWKVEKRFQDQL
ncbi:MAG: sugar transporter permease [Paenibacillus sp.]|jgi:multiple sugar transport system permease protein|nr:sugar transporter permease [Paenibacillus sp.]